MAGVVAGFLLGGLGLVALVAGPTVFAVVAVLLAVVLLADLAQLVARAGTRPVLLVALVPGIVLPVLVWSRPDLGWTRIADTFAMTFLLAFVVVLAAGRRRNVTAAVGATVLVSLLAGLGVSSLLLLRGLTDGFRWVGGLLLLAIAADVAAALAAEARRRQAAQPGAPPPDGEPGVAEAVAVPAAAVAVVGVALTQLLSPPWDLRTAALVGLVVVLAAAGGRYLHQALAADAGAPAAPQTLRLGEGLVLRTLDGVMLAAPAAYVLARAAVL